MTATPVPHRTPPIHPTSSEYSAQAAALERGGKPAEVLVKAARDLVVAAAIYQAAGPGTNGVRRYVLDAAAVRFRKHANAALSAGEHPAIAGGPELLAVTAAQVLALYTA